MMGIIIWFLLTFEVALKLRKQGGGRALSSISERLLALTAPCKEELCGCALWLWGMREPMCRPQEVEGSERCIWPSRCYCHSLSLAPVNPDWFYLPGFTFLVLAHPGSPGQNPEEP